MSFRFTQQPWNAIVARLELVIAGVGQTGLNPTVAIQRLSDSQWLQAGGGSWGAGFAVNNLAQVDAANQPGLYEYVVPSARLDYAASLQGYRLKYVEAGIPVLEYEFIETKPFASGEVAAGLATAGAPGTVTFNTWAPATANFYNQMLVTIVGGTGAGQTRLVTAYSVGRVATVYPNWTTNPDATSMCVVHAHGNPGWLTWEELRGTHNNVNSFGEGARLFELAAPPGAPAWAQLGHAIWRRNALTGAFGALPTGAEADWLSGGVLQNQWWSTIFAALVGGAVRGGAGTLIQVCDNVHAPGTRFYIAGAAPGAGSSEWQGTYAVYIPTNAGTLRPLDGAGAGGRVTKLVRVTAAGTDGTGNYLDIVDAITGGTAVGPGIAVGDWLIGLHTGSLAIARDIWETDIEAILGGSGGLMLPPTDSKRQRSASGLLQAMNEATIQGFRDATATEWGNVFVASAPGTVAKFYYTAQDGPGVSASADWAGKMAVWIVAVTGRRRLVKVTAVANDGAIHFALTLPDGTALPAATATNDRLIVLQGNQGLTVTDIFTASMSAYETAGTFGNHINRMLRLRQENMRVVYTAWSSHGQPTAGYVLLYSSSSDLNTDTGPGWALAKGRYDFTATYDGDLQLTGYESERTL